MTQPKTDLAYLRSEKAKAEQQLRYYQHREKILEHQIPELTRKARVHRLCTRAGIRTQKSMLMEYATRNGFGNCQYYVDDGYSGTNSDRPAFQELLDDIREGKVATVITKDYCAIIGLNQKDLENQGILA